MPPVGQNRTCGNGAPSALRAATPPLVSAGKNFISGDPQLEQAQDLAGGDGSREERATGLGGGARERSVQPGETMN